jgi:hypothetical protein
MLRLRSLNVSAWRLRPPEEKGRAIAVQRKVTP